jgi:mannose-1-phosphate guanylyltransferase
MLYALILAGGLGSRLWPKSRNALPKQFLNLTGQETMIQTTVRRILPLIPAERIFVVTGERYTDLVRQQLPALPESNIIAELSGKNTGPAIGLGALHIAQADPEATMVVLTADHLIPNEVVFRQAIQAAEALAKEGRLVTLGITPTGPETGFGYIQRGQKLGGYQGLDTYQVAAFLEKPALPMAQKFYESGEYYWNSGMFIWQVPKLMAEFQSHLPDFAAQLEQLGQAIFHNNGTNVADIWDQIKSESIDFGLMEKAKDVAVVPLDAGWNDVGSWAALYSELAEAPGHNVAINAEHLSVESQGILIQGNGKMIATIGLENVAIIQTDEVVLVCALDKTQDVKKIVTQLQAEKRSDYL